MGGERGGESILGGLSETQRRRRRYEGDDMKREIMGWEETAQEGEKKRGLKGGLRKSVQEDSQNDKGGGESWKRE